MSRRCTINIVAAIACSAPESGQMLKRFVLLAEDERGKKLIDYFWLSGELKREPNWLAASAYKRPTN